MQSTQSRFISRIALAAAIALAVTATACGGADGADEEKRAAETAAAEPGAPALQPNTPGTAVNGTVPGGIEAAARKLLAEELEGAEGEFTLDRSEGMGWPDASLGCPKEGWAYAQVLTPGYRLIFERAGTSYAVHTNADGSHMVICGDGR